jgi:lipopolysaccharide export system protein LptC
MKIKIGQYVLFFALLIVAVTSVFFLEHPESNIDSDEVKMADLKADYFLDDFKTVQYDNNGRVEYELKGHRLLHYPIQKASQISQPTMRVTRPSQATWELHSQTGRLEEDSQSLVLQGAVSIVREALGELSPLTINTEEMTIQTKQRTLNTDADVEIKSQSWTLRSTGLKTDLNNGKLLLLSNVRAHYENN